MNRLLTANEAADVLGVATSTIYSMLSRGEIRGVKVGRRLVRISPDTIDDLVAGRFEVREVAARSPEVTVQVENAAAVHTVWIASGAPR